MILCGGALDLCRKSLEKLPLAPSRLRVDEGSSSTLLARFTVLRNTYQRLPQILISMSYSEVQLRFDISDCSA